MEANDSLNKIWAENTYTTAKSEGNRGNLREWAG